MAKAAEIIEGWNDDTKEMARLVLEKYGEPDEVTESMLIWRGNGPWKRTIVYSQSTPHSFPKPHNDGVEQFIDYHVPIAKYSELAAFDGSVVVERTKGEISARCHDEEANFLALNLSHDIITGRKDVEQARDAYAQAMIDFRAGKDVPYMQRLHFTPQQDTADPDERTISDEQLQRAAQQGGKA